MMSMKQRPAAFAWLHRLTNLDSFCTNPDIPGEKRAKSGRVGGWAIRLVAALLSMFVQVNAGS